METVEVVLSDTPEERKEEALQALRGVAPLVSRTEDAIMLKAGQSDGVADRARQVLAGLGIEPDEIRLRKRSLEDVFIELTGRSLRD